MGDIFGFGFVVFFGIGSLVAERLDIGDGFMGEGINESLAFQVGLVAENLLKHSHDIAFFEFLRVELLYEMILNFLDQLFLHNFQFFFKYSHYAHSFSSNVFLN